MIVNSTKNCFQVTYLLCLFGALHCLVILPGRIIYIQNLFQEMNIQLILNII